MWDKKKLRDELTKYVYLKEHTNLDICYNGQFETEVNGFWMFDLSGHLGMFPVDSIEARCIAQEGGPPPHFLF